MPDLNTQFKALIKSRHASYDAAQWQFYWDAYRGGRPFLNYLHTHKKEDPEIFAMRKTRGYYFNYLKPLVRLVVDFIFQSEITRDPKADDFYENCDRKGTPLNEFMSQTATRAVVNGLHFVAVDNGSEPAENAAAEDVLPGPYCYHIDRADMLNFVLDEYGKPLWVLFKDYAPAESDPLSVAKTKTSAQHFKLWTRDYWRKITAELDAGGNIRRIDPGEEMPNDLGQITIEPFYGDFDSDWCGDSWICDMAYIAKALLNVSSLRDNYDYETAIEQLVLPGCTPEEAKTMLRGERYVITCNAEGNLPFVVSPTGTAATILQAHEADLIQHLYRLISQRITNASASADGASGQSKQVDFNTSTNTTLSGLADECERVENRIHEFRALYLNEAKPATAQYPDDFNVDAVDTMIRRAMDIQTLNPPDELMAFLLKQILGKMKSENMDQKEIDAIQTAIDEHYTALPEIVGGIAGAIGAPVAVAGMPAKVQQVPTSTATVNAGQKNANASGKIAV